MHPLTQDGPVGAEAGTSRLATTEGSLAAVMALPRWPRRARLRMAVPRRAPRAPDEAPDRRCSASPEDDWFRAEREIQAGKNPAGSDYGQENRGLRRRVSADKSAAIAAGQAGS